jgi:hypothetical protein
MPIRQMSQSELDELFGGSFIAIGMQKPIKKLEGSNSFDKQNGKLKTKSRKTLSNKSSSQ